MVLAVAAKVYWKNLDARQAKATAGFASARLLQAACGAGTRQS